MISCRYVISTNHGLHAANAMSLSRAASDYQCKITLESAKGVADCKKRFIPDEPWRQTGRVPDPDCRWTG